jgi:hypothetical protein
MSISRRELLRNAALAAVAGAIGRPARADQPAPAPPRSPAAPKLSPAAADEAQARYQTILHKYPGRFSEQDKALILKGCLDLQAELERLRQFPLANSDEPAHVFRPR